MLQIFNRDITWKLLSLALAMAIYFIVKQWSSGPGRTSNLLELSRTRSFTNLQVVVFATAADVREFKVKPELVSVVVSGRPSALEKLKSTDLRAMVDLTDIESARDLVKRVEVSSPPGITLNEVDPEYVDVVVPPKPGPTE